MKNIKWYLLTILLIFLDQLTKYIIRTNFELYQTKQLLPFFALTYTTNTGIAFGLFQGRYANFLLIGIVLVVLLFLIFSSKSVVEEVGLLGEVAVCLIISGGVGNLIDRIFLGKVTDFIDLQWNYKNIWPIFNLADSYVFVGVWIMSIGYLKKYLKK